MASRAGHDAAYMRGANDDDFVPCLAYRTTRPTDDLRGMRRGSQVLLNADSITTGNLREVYMSARVLSKAG
jgi:hypothetical protein